MNDVVVGDKRVLVEEYFDFNERCSGRARAKLCRICGMRNVESPLPHLYEHHPNDFLALAVCFLHWKYRKQCGQSAKRYMSDTEDPKFADFRDDQVGLENGEVARRTVQNLKVYLALLRTAPQLSPTHVDHYRGEIYTSRIPFSVEISNPDGLSINALELDNFLKAAELGLVIIGSYRNIVALPTMIERKTRLLQHLYEVLSFRRAREPNMFTRSCLEYSMANLLFHEGDFQGAIDLFESAAFTLSRIKHYNTKAVLACVKSNKSLAHIERLDFTGAQKEARNACESSIQLQLRDLEYITMKNTGTAYLREYQLCGSRFALRMAQQCLHKAKEGFEFIGKDASATKLSLAEVELLLGNEAKAIEFSMQVLQAGGEKMSWNKASAIEILARVARQLNCRCALHLYAIAEQEYRRFVDTVHVNVIRVIKEHSNLDAKEFYFCTRSDDCLLKRAVSTFDHESLPTLASESMHDTLFNSHANIL